MARTLIRCSCGRNWLEGEYAGPDPTVHFDHAMTRIKLSDDSDLQRMRDELTNQYAPETVEEDS